MIGNGYEAFICFSTEFEAQIPDPWQGEIERVAPGGDQRKGTEDKPSKAENQTKRCPAEMQETFSLKDGNVV